jgi:phosphoribosylaminoimidazolecarboxamide formyltransferase / IMP cyclohydrolase
MTDTGTVPLRRALLSVSDKTGLLALAQALAARGVELLSTGGSAKLLRDAGVTVREVADVTGFPEIMDGRVKTLHPKIHGGLLGRRGTDEAVMAQHGIAPIDLLVVNLYPFAATIAKPRLHRRRRHREHRHRRPGDAARGGEEPRQRRAVVDPADYAAVLAELAAAGGTSAATRRRLAAKAYRAHRRLRPWSRPTCRRLARRDRTRTLPARVLPPRFLRVQTLRYGENPHQQAAFYRSPDARGAGVATAAAAGQGPVLQQHRRCRHRDRMRAAVRRAGLRDRQARQSLRRRGRSDARSLRGRLPHRSDLGLRRHHRVQPRARCRDGQDHRRPAVRRSARGAGDRRGGRAVLAAKANLRVLETGDLAADTGSGIEIRSVNGGLLAQDATSAASAASELRVVTARAPSAAELDDLLFAWRVCKFVKSNAIVYARDGATIGVGAGQMSRVYSSRVAAMKAADEKLTVAGAVMASDAFFPFRDGIDVAAEYGIRAVIQPGGSGARRRSHRRRRRTRHRHGVHRHASLPALARRAKQARHGHPTAAPA